LPIRLEIKGGGFIDQLSDATWGSSKNPTKNATIKYGQFKQEEQQVIQEEQEQKSGIDA